MTAKAPAKVDYIKPLEDMPYRDVVLQKQQYHQEVKDRLAAIAGADRVKDDPETISRYSRDISLEQPGSPSFVVFPADTGQVCSIVKLANELLLPVVPVSSGTHNYGGAIPRMGGVVVDLSGWKKICKIDFRNRAARIEPGVTFGQLQEALEKEGLRSVMPLLPRRDQSVLTSRFEAQPATIPEFNYSEPIYTAEIVMPGGEIFRTGTASLGPPEENRTDLIGPWGPGFDWNRLYTRAQGTLGIVTWVNVMAEELPLKQKLYFTAGKSIDSLTAFTYRILRKWIGYECFILNRTALAWILAGKTPADCAALRMRLPEYVQVFCIGGLKRFPEERIAYQEADFLDTAQECGVNPQPALPEAPGAAPFFMKNLRRCWDADPYWKDVCRGACADIFFITTMNRAQLFIAAMQEECLRAGYNYQDTGVYLQPIENGRAAHLEFSIPYNPQDAQECAQVRQLHAAASRAMYSLGALFTRAYGMWAGLTQGRNAVQYQTARMVKETLDPNNIMNPGKLGL